VSLSQLHRNGAPDATARAGYDRNIQIKQVSRCRVGQTPTSARDAYVPQSRLLCTRLGMYPASEPDRRIHDERQPRL
jgi:hypothetical protein